MRIGLLFLVPAALAAGCITSRCFRDGDCPGSLVCDENGGCVEPECRSDGECPAGRVCTRHACVPGCRGDHECTPPQQCLDRRCVTIGDVCPCPMAPAFCGADLNPRSPTFEQEICVPGSFPDGVGIFFGSARCGHCLSDFDALRARAAELAADGLHPRLLWAQLKTAVVVPTDLEWLLGADVTDPLVHDTDALAIWENYGSTWYELVIVDAHGCLADRFPSLSASEIAGETGERIQDAWRRAMDDQCPPTATGDGGDAGGD